MDEERRIAGLEQQATADQEQIGKLEAQADIDRAIIAQLTEQEMLDRAQIANLQSALSTSRKIGAAMGIVMARLNVTEDEAFRLLTEASQRSHQKLRDVADRVLLVGYLEPT